jgi:CheY-like chemotaxis protein
MTTAFPDKEEECWEHGCDEFISKPNTSSELIPKIMKDRLLFLVKKVR